MSYSIFVQFANFNIKAFPIYFVPLKEMLNFLSFEALFINILVTASPFMLGRLENPNY